jgi:hypothetical protein
MDNELSDRGSRAAKYVEEAWRQIQVIEPCLPSAVVVILAGRQGKKRMGHFWPCTWKTKDDLGGHELAINPVLFESPEDLLNTLLHEAAHALLYEWGLNGGCGPDGYYHREEFRNVCAKLGLVCEFNNRRYGWNLTTWPKTGIPPRFMPVLELLHKEIPAGLKNGLKPVTYS